MQLKQAPDNSTHKVAVSEQGCRGYHNLAPIDFGLVPGFNVILSVDLKVPTRDETNFEYSFVSSAIRLCSQFQKCPFQKVLECILVATCEKGRSNSRTMT